MKDMTTVQAVPTTFEDLKKTNEWRRIRRQLKRTGKTMMVAESEAIMGRYSAVVLTGDGFQIESGKAGMTAAFSRGSEPTLTPIRTVREVAEIAIEMSGPMQDDPAGTPTPTEAEIVAKTFEKIKALLDTK